MPAVASSLITAVPVAAPSPGGPAALVPPGLLDALARVPDPRDRRERRFQLATLLAVGVCAMTCAGHNSLVSIAEWARRCEQEVLARLGCPYDPFAGRYRAPGECTLRDAFARVDPAALTAAGFAHLAALAVVPLAPVNPDGIFEREQRRAHRVARRNIRRRAIAVDGKCLRGAVRADGSKVFVLSAVRHDDALTAVLREIGAKTNEIPEFAPLLDQIADTDLTDAVVTVDALHAQTAHARYLVEQRQAPLPAVHETQPAHLGPPVGDAALV